MVCIWLFFFLLSCMPVQAAIINVSTSAGLTTALGTAVAGDEIVLANGTYSGLFSITGNNGTAAQPITIRAANPLQAIFVGDGVCDRSHDAFRIYRAYWRIKDLRLRDYGRNFLLGNDNIEIDHNVIDHFKEEGIRADGVGEAASGRVQFANIHHNVIYNGDTCAGTDSPGIYLVRNTDNSTVANNIIVATGDNGYQCGDVGGCTVGTKTGYGIYVASNSDDNLIQGNLFLANGGKGVTRILSDATNSTNADRNIFRDNIMLFGEGTAAATDDCSDDSNQFINNLVYGNYFWGWYTKGNSNGTRGHHLLQHNLFYEDDFTRGNVGFITSSGPCTNNTSKRSNTVRDNLFYSNGTQTGSIDTRILFTLTETPGVSQGSILTASDHNMFWAPGTATTWTRGYTFDATDIHSAVQQPIFTNALQGDFSLAASSPGKASASDGTDIGITYNLFLKKYWAQQAFLLPTQLLSGLTTSVAIPVDPSHYYQIWFYIPEPFFAGVETFVVEGDSRQRDINTLATQGWVQAGGPARWITLGRAIATDGTLNISWTNATSASKIFIRQIPTADEAYAWMLQAGKQAPGQILTAPGPLVIFADIAQNPNVLMSFAPGGIGIAPGAGRMSARYDKGIGSQPSLWEMRCRLSLTGTNVLGSEVQFYVSTSDGTDVDSGAGAGDAPLTTEQRRALPVGPLIFPVYQTVSNTTMYVSFRNIYIPGRYFSLGVFNNTALPLQNSTTGHRCTMTPMPYEMQ